MVLNCKINHNCVNLFQNELKELKFKKNNPNEKEKIKIRSSIDFNIFGIALPKIPENEGNNIEMNLISDNIILNKIEKFENYENLSIGLFDTNIIKINKNTDYFIEIKGIKNLDYISNNEDYTLNHYIEALPQINHCFLEVAIFWGFYLVGMVMKTQNLKLILIIKRQY